MTAGVETLILAGVFVLAAGFLVGRTFGQAQRAQIHQQAIERQNVALERIAAALEALQDSDRTRP